MRCSPLFFWESPPLKNAFLSLLSPPPSRGPLSSSSLPKSPPDLPSPSFGENCLAEELGKTWLKEEPGRITRNSQEADPRHMYLHINDASSLSSSNARTPPSDNDGIRNGEGTRKVRMSPIPVPTGTIIEALTQSGPSTQATIAHSLKKRTEKAVAILVQECGIPHMFLIIRPVELANSPLAEGRYRADSLVRKGVVSRHSDRIPRHALPQQPNGRVARQHRAPHLRDSLHV